MKIEIDKELFQWEKNRYVYVETYDSDPTITYVQFYNGNSRTGHEIELKDGRAQIPDYLLEEHLPVIAAACTGKLGETLVIARREFKVLKRARPVDYKDESDNPDGEVEDTPSQPNYPDYPGGDSGDSEDDEIIYDGGEEK